MLTDLFSSEQNRTNHASCFITSVMADALILYAGEINKLTSTETMIIAYIARGTDMSSLALIRGISPKTVSAHKRNSYSKMNISSDVELIHYLYILMDSEGYELYKREK